MANEKHLAILQRGVSLWNDWRNDFPRERPDISGTSLGAVDLRGVDFHDVDLQDSDLHLATFTDPGLFETTGQTRRQSFCANLSGANMARGNLREMDLCEADLTAAILNQANLCGGDLRKANFDRADLASADFTAANLHRANFFRADLSRAVLVAADLSGAAFIRTNLTSANLSGSDISNAKLFETIFANVDLGEVHGLEFCGHAGPSVIDHRTLALSKSLDKKFLMGVGLSDAFIQNVPRLVDQAESYFSCFISYSCADREFAEKLHKRLQESGIRCWLDTRQILPGDDVHREIDHGIRNWDKVLLCCSESSLTSWWVDEEIGLAFVKEREITSMKRKKSNVLIPLNLDNILFSDECDNGKKNMIIGRHVADFTGWRSDSEKFEKAFLKTVRALRMDEGAREKPPAVKL